MPKIEDQVAVRAEYVKAAEVRKSHAPGLPENGVLPWWEVERQDNHSDDHSHANGDTHSHAHGHANHEHH
jgi:hypothetical protein